MAKWEADAKEVKFACIRIYFDSEFSDLPRAELSTHRRVLGLAEMSVGQKRPSQKQKDHINSLKAGIT